MRLNDTSWLAYDHFPQNMITVNLSHSSLTFLILEMLFVAEPEFNELSRLVYRLLSSLDLRFFLLTSVVDTFFIP